MNDTAIRTVEVSRSEVATQMIGFGCKDDRAREIGIRIMTWTAHFAPRVDQTCPSHSGVAPGFYFVAEITTTRNGRTFGSGQRDNRFTTEDARSAYISKRIAAGRKAAAKKQDEAVRRIAAILR